MLYIILNTTDGSTVLLPPAEVFLRHLHGRGDGRRSVGEDVHQQTGCGRGGGGGVQIEQVSEGVRGSLGEREAQTSGENLKTGHRNINST